ncbi:S10 family peptidase [Methylosinus sp. Sm6]|uniref:S10 family peptidase n=1 Tax=Methylosinus sp. Sm6 TaxID=2866948 RepID=UPI001C9A247D|nr:peptidase S10 [Methylosinus sp. Sm6]MBY6241948.1 peptidase S10 [Methylosinus sp. Sm6]
MLSKFCVAFAVAAALATSSVVAAQPPAPPKKEVEEPAEAGKGLPAEVATTHTMTFRGEKITFVARAGAVRLRDAKSGAPRVDVSVVSYERSDADPAARPIAFVFNGGPGAASAWLGLGGISPWRLALGPQPPSPSAPPAIVDNAESWLPFVDLVFVDPPGTGFSKFLSDDEETRKSFFSTKGDADALAVVVRKWLSAHRRIGSPKYLVGESYGGFRAVEMLHALRERESVGVEGLVLISPALDFAWLDDDHNLLALAGRLPSYAAVAREARQRADLADVEAYASGEFVVDLLKGVRDQDAMGRLEANVARFTGLGSRIVEEEGGRIGLKTFLRDRKRGEREVVSAYDGEVAGFDPRPFSRESRWPDPVLDGLRAPLGAAMTRVTLDKLQWPVGDARYEILNDRVARDWDFGRGGRAEAESVSTLREELALDRRLEVTIAHGLADLVTPYFVSKLLIDQLPGFGAAPRVKLVTTPGGHMAYLRDDARRMLRDAARAAIERK